MHDASDQRWKLARQAYYVLLAAWFALVAFYSGPSLLLFQKLTWLSPADFVGIVQERCIPAVRAAKDFERDHGRFPLPDEDLAAYGLTNDRHWGDVEDGVYRYRALDYHHRITYDLSGRDSRWRVDGPFTSGVIPVPPAALSPTTRPGSTPVR